MLTHKDRPPFGIDRITMGACVAYPSRAILCLWFFLYAIPSGFALRAGEPIRVGIFQVDASPPVGSPLAYDPTIAVQSPLSCRGIIILSDQQPIVLGAVDWLGIANGSQWEFRSAFAEAAETTVDRVSIHTIHQHDAPRCDFSVDQLLKQQGVSKQFYDVAFARDVIKRAAAAIKQAKSQAQVVTHLGLGQGTVEKVASNRRILGEDGKVKVTRYTATSDPEVRAAPVGTIDPLLKMVSFWNDDQPIVAITYYATHPQSYYRTGKANPDFPGMARNARELETKTPHIHFNGAGGNIGAGKWNDGAPENRQVLADRVAAGMKLAWDATSKQPIDSAGLAWQTVNVQLPAAPHLDEKKLIAILQDKSIDPDQKMYAGKDLVWLRRTQQGETLQISCLKLAKARVLFMPGELFVEYQLAAQTMKPELFVAMAAYGEYAPGYIGTKIAYSQGGYETSQRASRVAADVEKVLMDGMKELLDRD